MEVPHNCSYESSNTPDFLELSVEAIEYELEDASDKFFKIKLKRWRQGIFILNILSLIFCTGSLVSPRWVEQGNPEKFWRGGLINCTGCNGKWAGTSYRDIINQSCNNMPGYCNTYQKLFNGGISVILIESAFCILSVLVIGLKLFKIINKNAKAKIINLAVAFSTACQVLAVIIWFAVTEARLDKSCYDRGTTMKDAYTVCATHGPILLIVSMILNFFSSFLHYCIRFVNKKPDDKVSPYVDS